MTTLREAAKARGIYIGTSVTHHALLSDSHYRDLLAREFNLVTPEVGMKWRELSPTRHTYDFEQGDTLVAFAEAHNMAVMGHVLVWHSALPPWAQIVDHSRDEWLAIMRNHIYTVVGHYRGRVKYWQVVNEVFELDGNHSDSFWRERIGPDYIAQAFRWAHEADPAAILLFNEWDADGHKATAQYVVDLVTGLQAEGVPIQGVGMQMHIAADDNDWVGAPPTPEQVAAQMTRLAQLGLSTHITEMDVMLQYTQGSAAEKLARQAEIYGGIVRAALGTPYFQTLNLWGLSDKYSWIPLVTKQADAPLLFDQHYQPKPAYDSVLAALREG